MDGVEGYYRGEYSLGHMAETVNVPLRTIIEFMQKYKLPYYSDSSDAEAGLKKISRIRSTRRFYHDFGFKVKYTLLLYHFAKN
ncbi:MAG: hypothetical protein JRN20_19200 [Nitrososphaerota archaeon]|nr:hypothetical protein [Nitrososphaerota archaeon]